MDGINGGTAGTPSAILLRSFELRRIGSAFRAKQEALRSFSAKEGCQCSMSTLLKASHRMSSVVWE
jgi:hypothetical protein